MSKENEYMLHGIGKSQLVFPDGNFLNIDFAQDLSIETSASEGKIQGGDGLYDLMTYLTEKSAKMSITNAKFSLEAIQAGTGSKVVDTAEIFVPKDYKAIVAGACTLSQVVGVQAESVVAKVSETGEVLTRITTGTPTAKQFTVTATGLVKVDTTLTGKDVEFSYFYTGAGKSIPMLEDDIPQTCEFRHTILTDAIDGKRYQISIRVFRAKATGSYTYGAKRGDAFAPKLELTILDAGRLDKKVMVYSVSEYKESVI